MRKILLSIGFILTSQVNASDLITDQEIPRHLKEVMEPILHKAYDFKQKKARASISQLRYYRDKLYLQIGDIIKMKNAEILNKNVGNIGFYNRTLIFLQQLALEISRDYENAKRF